ncbi:MAG TPA: hypothetical protein VF199_13840, partial [Bacillales bacterium]
NYLLDLCNYFGFRAINHDFRAIPRQFSNMNLVSSIEFNNNSRNDAIFVRNGMKNDHKMA